jgi:hypothetical protein
MISRRARFLTYYLSVVEPTEKLFQRVSISRCAHEPAALTTLAIELLDAGFIYCLGEHSGHLLLSITEMHASQQ